MPNFTTRNQAAEVIAQSIEATGEASRTEYDLDAIVDAVTVYDADRGYVVTDDVDEFWATVAAGER